MGQQVAGVVNAGGAPAERPSSGKGSWLHLQPCRSVADLENERRPFSVHRFAGECLDKPKQLIHRRERPRNAVVASTSLDV